MTGEHNIEVSQMDAVGRLGVAIKRIAEKDAEIKRLTGERDLERRRLKTSEDLRCGLVGVIERQSGEIKALHETIGLIDRQHAAEINTIRVQKDADIRRISIECGKANDDNARLRAALQLSQSQNYCTLCGTTLEPKP